MSSFESAPLAWIYRNQLVDFGLDAIVTDEFTVATYWLYSNAIGGVKVQIPTSHMTLLDEFLDRNSIARICDRNTNSTSNKTTCLECGSDEISISKLSIRWIFLIWLLAGIPIPIYSRSTYCYDCGARSGPPSTFSGQFNIVHLLYLMTFVAVVLGISIQLGTTWISHSANLGMPR